MNKKELVTKISEVDDITKADGSRAVDAFISTVN